MSTKRTTTAAILLLAVLLGGCGTPAAGGRPTANPPGPDAVRTPRAMLSRAPSPSVSYPAAGRGRWSTASAEAPTPAGSGRLLRYRVSVERDISGLPVAEVAEAITATLNDRRGWTGGGNWRLRRVGPDQRADFTIYLATPGTRDVLCQDIPDGYTSCRNGDRVVLNVARWVKGIPGYGAGLETYRQYMVNHEVGHRLGLGHERCPGRGLPAPVMQQQTLGMHGCSANAWPYVDGKRHRGPVGAYDDDLPAREGAYRM
jgi:hypothetical protein